MKPIPHSSKLLYTAKEVAQLTGLAEGTIYHFVSQKRIPVVRISARCIRFERRALEEWISSLAEPVDGSKETDMNF